VTLPATGAGRSELRGTRCGAAKGAPAEWAIRRTWKASGEGASAYADAMGSPQGWPYILERYRSTT
jgi:hypothetical protein